MIPAEFWITWSKRSNFSPAACQHNQPKGIHTAMNDSDIEISDRDPPNAVSHFLQVDDIARKDSALLRLVISMRLSPDDYFRQKSPTKKFTQHTKWQTVPPGILPLL
jgi:hypothetical protein